MALAHDGQPVTLLLDAGTGIRQVWRLLNGSPFDGTVLLGHLHWDHTQGLPFFRPGDDPESRVDLYLPAQPGDPEGVLARGMSPPQFPIRPSELRGRWSFRFVDEGLHDLEGFTVLAREIPHKGGRTFGYRVSDGSATVAYLSDHHPITCGPGPTGFGEHHEAACALVDGVDLLIHDAQYTAEEFPARAHFGHSTIDYAVTLGEARRVGEVLLFHHDPPRTDDEIDQLVTAFGGRTVAVSAAADGTVIDLPRHRATPARPALNSRTRRG
ncbi:MAG: hypothetical protein KY462_05270 [Actinobacteria bacterium]|nr:hypothetical protein [Actinomycetota bacterium]